MKRGVLLTGLIILVLIGIYSIKEWMPVMAISGTSMEPLLHRGDAIIIEKTTIPEVKVGDVIVFKVHPLVQKQFHYPEFVAHRVTEITKFQSDVAFKTQGDNTAADPFVVPGYDVRGKVKTSVPVVGNLVLYLQSQQGRTFAFVALVLLAIYLYGTEINQSRRRLQEFVFAPVLEESQQQNKVLESKLQYTQNKIDATEQKIDATKQAMNDFSSAMKEYAQHLASHTAAVKSLAAASQELRDIVHDQKQIYDSVLTSKTPPAAAPALNTPEVCSSEVCSSKETVPGCYCRRQPATESKPLPPNCYRARVTSGK